MQPYATCLTPDELEHLLESRARVGPALRAIHGSSPTGRLPDRAAGVASHAWEKLRGSFDLPAVEVIERALSMDGTTRLLLDFGGARVETVLIPGEGRTTVCVSSQSGCGRSCRFCATGRLRLERNLFAGEIVLQVLIARDEARSRGLTEPYNVVFMGMGEPMDNLEQVARAIEVLTASPSPGVAARRITVSTSGVLPETRRFLECSPAQLALSLHATTDEHRARLIPHTRRCPIRRILGEITDALEGDGRLLFVEYLLLGGSNDSPEDARRLADLLQGVPCRVNLIPFNPAPGLPFEEPSPESADAFASILSKAGMRTIVRTPRGRDVAGACGQLAGRPKRPSI